MNSGLNSLLFTKCMVARTITRKLQQERHTKHKHHCYAGNEIDDGEDENQIDDEFGDNNDNGFETSCEDGENAVDDDNEEENEEDEEDDENDQESEEEDVND
ncbi:unnamed protein product [Prunus brigantina]